MLVPLLSLLSSLGVLILWAMDQFLYTIYIEAHFFEALKFENDYDFLPKVYTKLPFLFGRKGAIHSIRIYYLGCTIAPVFIAILFILPKNFVLHSIFLYTFACLSFVTIIAAGLYLFFWKPDYRALIKKR